MLQRIKTALNLNDGADAENAAARIDEMRQAIERKDREIAQLKTRPPASGGDPEGGVRPENITWMFGSGRTGSNWLMAMMREATDFTRWHEPMVGALFSFYYSASAHHGNSHFILGSPHRVTWLRSIRSFVLEGARARFPEVSDEGHVLVREPTGSTGAPLLMEALPESRMILLIRDPRDVVASLLDGSKEGGWLSERGSQEAWKRRYAEADNNPDAFVKKRSNLYLQNVERAKQAYDEHGGRKVVIKYEDLRADTLATMRRLYETLEIPADEAKLARVVEKHSWENIPEEDKGEGKFRRKAVSGAWREDLTPEQAEIVEETTAPLLNAFYSA